MKGVFEIIDGVLTSSDGLQAGEESEKLSLRRVRQLALINNAKVTVGLETGDEDNRHFLIYYSEGLRDYFYPHLFFTYSGGMLVKKESAGEMEKWGVIGKKIYSLERDEIGEGIVEMLGEASSSTCGRKGIFIFQHKEKFYHADTFLNEKFLSGKKIIAKMGPFYYTESGFHSTIIGCYLISLMAFENLFSI